MSFRYINIYIGVRAKGEDETVARSRNSTFVKLYVQFKLHFVKKRCAKILLLSPDKWSAHPRNDFKRPKKHITLQYCNDQEKCPQYREISSKGCFC